MYFSIVYYNEIIIMFTGYKKKKNRVTYTLTCTLVIRRRIVTKLFISWCLKVSMEACHIHGGGVGGGAGVF